MDEAAEAEAVEAALEAAEAVVLVAAVPAPALVAAEAAPVSDVPVPALVAVAGEVQVLAVRDVLTVLATDHALTAADYGVCQEQQALLL